MFTKVNSLAARLILSYVSLFLLVNKLILSLISCHPLPWPQSKRSGAAALECPVVTKSFSQI